MQDNQEAILTFPVQHSVFISPDQSEIEQIDEIELTPHIQIKETTEEVIVSGYLMLEGKYAGKPPRFPDISLDDPEVKVTGYVDSVVFNPFAMDPDDFETENELTPFTEKIPVHICIARSKIEDVGQIYASITSFDYDVQSARKLAIMAELALNGVRSEVPTQPKEEHVTELPRLFEYVASKQEDEEEAEQTTEEARLGETELETEMEVEDYIEEQPNIEPITFKQTPDSDASASEEETTEIQETETKSEISLIKAEIEQQNEEVNEPQIEQATVKEVDKPQIEQVKAEEANKPQIEQATVKEVDKPQIEQVKAEEADKPQTEQVKAEEADKPQIEQAKVEEADKPQTEQVKAEEVSEPQIEPPKAKEESSQPQKEKKEEESMHVQQVATESRQLQEGQTRAVERQEEIEQEESQNQAEGTEETEENERQTTVNEALDEALPEEEKEEAKVSITLKGTKRDPVTVTTSLLSSYAQREATPTAKQTEAEEVPEREEEMEESEDNERNETEKKEGALYLTSFMRQEKEEFTRLKMCIAQQDETLDGIADKYNVSPADIAMANGLHTNATVAKGQVLYIPVKS
ncbi:LysM peptidoglycan-binding domain-containing protein [Aneurinibacillus migulanus]|uniref:LysM peptidoglycan-binding domain-containing protein n=1 Tax=Aneurinibacillus migulanus TaxID=47500 RepID=UPI002E22D630|nr:LysM peptidoglycan-binding domain-containing protein [Aneurinibacillus migulanus]